MSPAQQLHTLQLETAAASMKRVGVTLTRSPSARLRAALILADLAGAGCALLCGALLASFAATQALSVHYLRIWPLLAFFVASYATAGLYNVPGIHPVEELRRMTIATSGVFLVLGCLTFMFRDGVSYSRGFYLFTWMCLLLLGPLSRAVVRAVFGKASWWGFPAFVIGPRESAAKVIRALKKECAIGIRPVAVFDSDGELQGEVEGVSTIGDAAAALVVGRELGVQYAIVASPRMSRENLGRLLNSYSNVFAHLLLLTDFLEFSSLWVDPVDLGGSLGLQVRQNLLSPGARRVKRLLDLVLTLIGGVAILPLIALIVLLVRATSAGPAFYAQERMGIGGSRFRAWKFRTMVADAGGVLAAHLARDPAMAREWAEHHKLQHDPRVTGVGRLLRATSLDELPQLWNVLRGEMSLVGPRPIVEDEIVRYADAYQMIARVRPGITGLWQVSGRSTTGYGERVRLDSYYIRNWSVWLDLHILVRTLRAVVVRQGAY